MDPIKNDAAIRRQESLRLDPPESSNDSVCVKCRQFYLYCPGHPKDANKKTSGRG